MTIARAVLFFTCLAAAGCGDDAAGTTTGAQGGNDGAGGGPGAGGDTATTSSSGGAPGTTTAGVGGAGGEGPFTLMDPLRNTTVGNQQGGTLGPDGWTVTGNADRIIYILPRLVEGSVEFTMSNVTMDNLPLSDHEVFAMYEGGYDIEEPIAYNPDFRNNHYKCMLRIYGQQEVDRAGQQKLMWGMCPSGAPGYDECGCASFFEEPFGGDGTWDGSPQRLRIEWAGGVTRFLRNDVPTVEIDWSGSGLQFGPDELHLSIGTPRPLEVGSASMPIGAVFSDVVIEGVTGPGPATCP